MSEIKEWAEKYRAIGWNIIPLYEFSKNPNTNKKQPQYINNEGRTVRGWLPLQTRVATDEEFKEWFIDSDPTGIGLICGNISNLFAVDEDSYKADGMTFEFTSPFRSRTARGGRHHFFKFNPNVKTTGFRKGVNIEIKSEGGFVVLPPSRVYIDDKKTIGKYEWESKVPLSQIPELSEEKLAKYKGNGQSNSEDIRDLLKVGTGSQHNSLRSLALKTFARFPRGEWDIAEKFIRDAASQYDPPHPEYRVNKMISDCRRFVEQNPLDKVEAEVKSEIKGPRLLGDLVKERLLERELEKDAPKTGYEDLDGIIKGFIPGHLYVMTGETNVGKTSFACNLTDRVLKQNKKVLYFALEPGNMIVDVLASIRHDKRYDDLQPTDISSSDQNLHVYGKQEIDSVGDLLNVIRGSNTHYDLIVVDHIGYFVKSENGWIQQQSNIMKELAWLAKESKTAIMIIAHLRKKMAGQKNHVPTPDDISGSASFKQDATEVLILTRKYDDAEGMMMGNEGILYVVKTKVGPPGAIDLYFSTNKASIRTLDEIMGTVKSQTDRLSAFGFPDKKIDK